MPTSSKNRYNRSGFRVEKDFEIIKLRQKLEKVLKERDILKQSNENRVELRKQVEIKDKEIEQLKSKVYSLERELEVKTSDVRRLEEAMERNQKTTEEKLKNMEEKLDQLLTRQSTTVVNHNQVVVKETSVNTTHNHATDSIPDTQAGEISSEDTNPKTTTDQMAIKETSGQGRAGWQY